MDDRTLPKLGAGAFRCPRCNTYAQQRWKSHSKEECYAGFFEEDADEYVCISTCVLCGCDSIWCNGKLIFPQASLAPLPNPDLAEDIIIDYNEAASILQVSPRGACALLRLATQKLCVQLGEDGKNLNDNIANLVKRGLSPQIQKSLDILRVVGNNAVHPGELDIKDAQETALALFKLINKIADTMITDVKEIDDIYGSLPEKQKEAIVKRDGR